MWIVICWFLVLFGKRWGFGSYYLFVWGVGRVLLCVVVDLGNGGEIWFWYFLFGVECVGSGVVVLFCLFGGSEIAKWWCDVVGLYGIVFWYLYWVWF